MISGSVTDTRRRTFRLIRRWTRRESRMRFLTASIVMPCSRSSLSNSSRVGTFSRFIRSASSSSTSMSSTMTFSRSASWSWRRLSIIRVRNWWTSSSVGAVRSRFSYR